MEICNGAQGASMIHNAVRDQLLVECRRTGLKVYKETQHLLSASGDKLADLLLTAGLDYIYVYIYLYIYIYISPSLSLSLSH